MCIVKLLAVVLLCFGSVSITGCAGNDMSFFDKLEFKEGQEGCVRANGSVKLGGNPFAQSEVNINLVKKQGENSPDC